MTASKVALTGFPLGATMADYEQAGEELERALSRLPGAIAVYRYGGISAPGISDLDRLVVTEGDRAIPSVWPQLTERTRYLAMHTPVHVDPEAFSRHRWFAELGQPVLVWGTPIRVEERPLRDYSEPLLAGEALVVMALKLLKLSVTGRAKVRPWLCELSNMRLDLELGRIARDDAPGAWALADEVTRLRHDWWNIAETARRTRTRAVLESAAPAVQEALRMLAAPLTDPAPDRRLRLYPPWRNVTLDPGEPASHTPRRLASLVGQSKHLGEARWRLRSRSLQVPPPLIQLLAGPAPEAYMEFRAERNRLIRRHTQFVASAPGYSGLRLGVTAPE